MLDLLGEGEFTTGSPEGVVKDLGTQPEPGMDLSPATCKLCHVGSLNLSVSNNHEEKNCSTELLQQ